jgi:hypothetical protein
MTALLRHAGATTHLPADIPALMEIVRSVLIHPFELREKPHSTRSQGLQVRRADALLGLITALDPSPLTVQRPPSRRVVGNCRHFAVLLCALLRQQGIPARARVGFAHYLDRPKWTDHWVCEYWLAKEHRWVRVDPGLGPSQARFLQVTFQPGDVPTSQFLSGSQMWLACRSEQIDPSLCGFLRWRGWWWVRSRLLQDIAALNKMELLPWDGWWGSLLMEPEANLTKTHLDLLDTVATVATAEGFSELRQLYVTEPWLTVPESVSFVDLRRVGPASETTGRTASAKRRKQPGGGAGS